MNNPPNHPGLEGYQLVRLGHIHEGDIIVDPETGDRHAATLGHYGTPVWVDDQGREAGGSYVYRKYEPVVAPTIDLAGYQNVRHGPVKIGDVIVYNGEIRNADWLAGLEVGECGTVEIHAKAHGDCERQLHRVYRKIPVAKQGLSSDGTVLKSEQADAPQPRPNLASVAAKLVLGDRNESYGNPRDDYEGTAKVWSGLLRKKLKADITPEEAILMMVGLKLNREFNKHNDDNIVDSFGYLLCHEWARTGEKPC